MPHQLHAAERIAEAGKLYLGDPPGLGKTRSVLAALGKMDCARPLIVCPSIVKTHWLREAQLLFGGDFEITVKSYGEIVSGGGQLMAQLIHRERVGALVLDEAHYLKHPSAQRTQVLLGKDGYARRFRHVVPLSGTPVPRHPGELWTILSTVFPEVVLHHGIRSSAEWVNRFCITRPQFVRGQMKLKVVGVRNVEELQVILNRVMLRRGLDEIGMSLPAVWPQVVRLDAGDVAAIRAEHRSNPTVAALATALANGTAELAAIAEDPHIARMRRRIGELKVAPVLESLRSQLADSQEKVFVTAYHRTVLSGLREGLRSFGVCYVDGDTSPNVRVEEIARFRREPDARVFLGQQVACGTGMDGLQYAARRVVLVEPSWTAAENEQTIARLRRMGQRGTVIAQLVALSDTLDEAIVGQNAREIKMVNSVMGET